MCGHICTKTHACMHTQTCMHTLAHTHTHTLSHADTLSHMHSTHTHTHAQACTRKCATDRSHGGCSPARGKYASSRIANPRSGLPCRYPPHSTPHKAAGHSPSLLPVITTGCQASCWRVLHMGTPACTRHHLQVSPT